MSRVVLLTGISAAGKSTVGQALAERLPRSVHLRGDLFRRMVVNGRTEPGTDPWLAELRLRYTLAANAADTYAAAGYDVVWQDVVIGPLLGEVEALVQTRPFDIFVLAPQIATVHAREAARSKTGYGDWTAEDLDRILRDETPRIGQWIDSPDQNVDETVAGIVEAMQSAPNNTRNSA